jgi:hypothetical protein
MELQPTNWTQDLPTDCELCHRELDTAFVDGKTDLEHGPWACMCLPCHERHGVGFGPGRGQLYERQGEEFLRVPSTEG